MTEEEKAQAKEQRESELRLWLAVRSDLNMPAGKLATQAGHGYASLLLRVIKDDPDRVWAYQNGGRSPKITVRVDSEADLERVALEAFQAKIPFYLVTDAGHTVFEQPTMTVCAFGPCRRDELPNFLKRLRLL